MMMTTVTYIKKVEEECVKLCEERTQIWADLVEYLEMKVVEAKLREAKEKAEKYLESINTLQLTERMKTLLAASKSYVEVENMRDQ
jgi:hypothetical protein